MSAPIFKEWVHPHTGEKRHYLSTEQVKALVGITSDQFGALNEVAGVWAGDLPRHEGSRIINSLRALKAWVCDGEAHLQGWDHRITTVTTKQVREAVQYAWDRRSEDGAD